MKKIISMILSLSIALSCVSNATLAVYTAEVQERLDPLLLANSGKPAEKDAEVLDSDFDPEEYVWRRLNETNRFIVKSSRLIMVGDVLGDRVCINSEPLYTNCESLKAYRAIELDASVLPEEFIPLVENSVDEIYPDTLLNLAGIEETEEIHPTVFDMQGNLSAAQTMSDGSGVLIALLDNGVDTTHPDLSGHLVEGWDLVHNSPNTDATGTTFGEAHGTHVAGIIASVAPGAKIMPLQVTEYGAGYVSTVIAAIKYAEDHGAVIANCSWTTEKENPLLKIAMESSPLFFVAAVGNSGFNMDDTPVYPASYGLDNLISVASVDTDGALSYFSNYGTGADVAAWGEQITGAMPGGETESLSGTSMAAAYVSGAAALALAADTDVSGLKTALKASSDHAKHLADTISNGNMLNFHDLLIKNFSKKEIDIPLLPASTYFTAAEDNSKIVQIATGHDFVIARKENGDVWGWGGNAYGQLADNSFKNRHAPQKIRGTYGGKIYAGGFSAFAANSWGYYAWGDNYYGQLGNGVSQNRIVSPEEIYLASINRIALDQDTTLILKEDGTVWTLGYNKGQKIDDVNKWVSPHQVREVPSSEIVDVGCNKLRNYLLDKSNNLYFWGRKFDSRETTKEITLAQRSISKFNTGMVSAVALSLDNYLYLDGHAYGDIHSVTPAIGDRLETYPLSFEVEQVDCGLNHVICLDKSGHVWTAGANQLGQLGLGTTDSQYHKKFVQVPGLENIVAVAATSDSNVALQSDGTVWTWGYNASGELGTGTKENSAVPVQVDFANAEFISASYKTPLVIEVPYGTKFDDIEIPDTAMATTNKGEKEYPVIWDFSKSVDYTSSYESNRVGDHKYWGTYDTKYNPNSERTTLNLKVLPAEITAIENPTDLEYNIENLPAELPLSQTVDVTLNDGSHKDISVTWDTSTFDPELIGERQLITGTLTLPWGVTNPNGLTPEIGVTVQIEKIVVKIDAPQNVYLTPLVPADAPEDYGLVESVDLPEMVSISISETETHEVPVVWDVSAYDPTKAELQIFDGELQLPDDLKSAVPSTLKAELQVNVLPRSYQVIDALPMRHPLEVYPGATFAQMNEKARSEEKLFYVLAIDLETDLEVITLCPITFVAEDNPSFTKDVPGEYTLTARLPDNFASLDDLDVTAAADFPVTVTEPLAITGTEPARMDTYQSVAPENLTGIPAQVNATLESGMVIPIDVEWDWSGYEKDAVGEQFIPGELVSLPSMAVQPEEEIVPILIVNVLPVSYEVTGLIGDNLIEADAGFTLEELTALLKPTLTYEITSTTAGVNIVTDYTVSVTLEDEKNPDYTPEVDGYYQLLGTPALPANIVCPAVTEGDPYEMINLLTQPVDVVSVEPVYILADEGTPFDQLPLPTQVVVTLSSVGPDGSNKKVTSGVDWGMGADYTPLPESLTDDSPVTQEVTGGELADYPAYVNGADVAAPLFVTLSRVYDLVAVSPSRVPAEGSMKVKLGSTLEEIYALLDSHSVELTLQSQRGETHTAPVTFQLREEDNAHYDPLTLGSYSLKGCLSLSDNIRDPNGLELSPELAVETVKYTISSSKVVRLTNVPSGTAFADLALPELVTVVRNDKATEDIPVTWLEGKYDPDKLGSQAIRGDFTLPLPIHLENPNKRQANAIITVVNPSANILSLEQLTGSVALFSATAEDMDPGEEAVPGFTELRYLAEIQWEDGSTTFQILSVFVEEPEA